MSQQQKKNHPEAVLPRLTLILAKIAEILHWCLVGIMLVLGIIAIVQPKILESWLGNQMLREETNLSCYGFEAAVFNNGVFQPGGAIFFALGSAIVLSLMAMVFRNVYLILKTAKGKTWFAKGNTPFQKNIVRMFREIGIFLTSVSVMSLISGIVVNLTGGELSNGFNYLSCFIGLVFLCISQFFNYGTRLEKDLDGLV